MSGVEKLIAELLDVATQEESSLENDVWTHEILREAASALATLQDEKEKLEKENEALRAAAAPFAAYAKLSGFDRLPDNMALTPGSGMAAKQVTVSDFRRAARALSTSTPSGGDHG